MVKTYNIVTDGVCGNEVPETESHPAADYLEEIEETCRQMEILF